MCRCARATPRARRASVRTSKWHRVIRQSIALSMVSGARGTTIRRVLPRAESACRREHACAAIRRTVDNRALVQRRKPSYATPTFPVRVRAFDARGRTNARVRDLVDGQWTSWSSPSPCSVSCGVGFVRESRRAQRRITARSFRSRFARVRAHKWQQPSEACPVRDRRYSVKRAQLHRIARVRTVSSKAHEMSPV